MLDRVSLLQTGGAKWLRPTPQFRFESCAAPVQLPHERFSVLTFLYGRFYLDDCKDERLRSDMRFQYSYAQTHSFVPLHFEVRYAGIRDPARTGEAHVLWTSLARMLL